MDTLEVQLRESADLVDVIFIVEATVTHHGVRGSYSQTCKNTVAMVLYWCYFFRPEVILLLDIFILILNSLL